MNIQLIGIFLVLAMNAGALVWGAAKVTGEVRYLRETLDRFMDKMEATLEGVGATLQDHSTRIGRIEGRLQ